MILIPYKQVNQEAPQFGYVNSCNEFKYMTCHSVPLATLVPGTHFQLSQSRHMRTETAKIPISTN
jgi:hypothetical protein